MKIKVVRKSSHKNTDKLVILSNFNDLAWAKEYFTPKSIKSIKEYALNKKKQFCFFSEDQFINVIFVEEEKNESFSNENFRLAGNSFLTFVENHQLDTLVVIDKSSSKALIPFTEGLILGSYVFHKYKKEDKDAFGGVETINLIGDVSKVEIDSLVNITTATFISRDLVNEPFSYLTAPRMSADIELLGEKFGFGVEVLDKKKITSLKMGGILAVNKASKTEPRFTIMTHKPKNATNKKPIVLVGKGIVYDTGGLSIKPTGNSMDFMKSDMGGAATVIGTFVAIAAQKLPLWVIGLIPSTDNVVSADAYAPGDVITMYDGTTVEVLNTDAEGRLVLADALHYAKKYKPELVIDFATLTGSAAFAVGQEAVCMMGTASEEVKAKMKISGNNTYERLVEFPLWKEYGEYLKSNIADLRNLATVPAAGMITAGKFLEHFTDYNWMHIDIAGSAFLKGASGYRPKEGTGVGVRLCYDFLNNY